MSIWSKLFGEQRASKFTLGHPANLVLLQPSNTTAGLTVNESTCLSLSAVWAAVNVISSAVASLPLILYERQTRGKRRATEHPLYRLLHDAPNNELTALDFRQTLQSHLLLYGAAYAEIERTQDGRPLALWILPPNRVQPERTQRGEIVYKVQEENGQAKVLPAQDVFSLQGLSFNGLVGYNPTNLHRETIGTALAQEQFTAKFFGSGSVLAGVLQHPGRLTDEARKNLRESWNELHSGKPHKVAILEEQMEWRQISVNPSDATLEQARQFSVLEICRLFCLDPVWLSDWSSGQYDNAEAQMLQFYRKTLLPHLLKWEAQVRAKLLMPDEQDRFFAEHLVEGLLRADTKTRYEAYQIGLSNGFLDLDGISDRENTNPPPEGIGSQLLRPMNMTPRESTLTKEQLESVLQILDRVKSGLDVGIAQSLIDNVAPNVGIKIVDHTGGPNE